MSTTEQIILAGTGHRLDRLGGFNNITRYRLYCLAHDALQHYRPNRIISGFAVGWDLALAAAAIDLNIPLTAAIPCYDQERLWTDPYDLTLYYKSLERADEIIYVTSGPYDHRCMQLRNIWMVDHTTHVLALSNGSFNGGTANCIAYARQQNKEPINLWSLWVSDYSKRFMVVR